MKRSNLFLIALFFINSIVIAQTYSEDSKKFIYKNKLSYELSTVETEDKYGLKAILKVKKVKNELLSTIKKIEIPETGYDADLIGFGEFIDNTRKFILLKDRYSFYILNFYNNKLLGPFKPKFLGVGQDAQSAMITDLHIILDGRFITGYCVDSGSFLIDLTNLYNPIEVTPANHPLLNENHVYILQQLDHKKYSFGLFIKTDGWKVSSKTIFINKMIKIEDYGNIFTKSDIQIEEIIIKDQYINGRYTIIKEFLSENKFKFLVIDNTNGNFVTIPKHLQSSEKGKLLLYLNNK